MVSYPLYLIGVGGVLRFIGWMKLQKNISYKECKFTYDGDRQGHINLLRRVKYTGQNQRSIYYFKKGGNLCLAIGMGSLLMFSLGQKVKLASKL